MQLVPLQLPPFTGSRLAVAYGEGVGELVRNPLKSDGRKGVNKVDAGFCALSTHCLLLLLATQPSIKLTGLFRKALRQRELV